MAAHARPTLRCLREDLKLAVPHADILLEEISHPLLAKVTERFADDQTRKSGLPPLTTRCCSRSKSSAGGVPYG